MQRYKDAQERWCGQYTELLAAVGCRGNCVELSRSSVFNKHDLDSTTRSRSSSEVERLRRRRERDEAWAALVAEEGMVRDVLHRCHHVLLRCQGPRVADVAPAAGAGKLGDSKACGPSWEEESSAPRETLVSQTGHANHDSASAAPLLASQGSSTADTLMAPSTPCNAPSEQLGASSLPRHEAPSLLQQLMHDRAVQYPQEWQTLLRSAHPRERAAIVGAIEAHNPVQGALQIAACELMTEQEKILCLEKMVVPELPISDQCKLELLRQCHTLVPSHCIQLQLLTVMIAESCRISDKPI